MEGVIHTYKNGSSSPYEYYVKLEQDTREYKIAIESKAIIREQLSECFRREGVNHQEKCKELSKKYFALCGDRFNGMKFRDGEEPANRKLHGIVSK